MTDPIKPGTRCECRDGKCITAAHWGNTIAAGQTESPKACTNDAVRLVAVPGPRVYDFMGSYPETISQVPMCAACAEWHERDEYNEKYTKDGVPLPITPIEDLED